jgi:16S rRNA (cytidine1402-2'-O)-methyltransferase
MTRSAPVAGQRPTLFVVATPIGNLEDITLRALRVLREVSVVAAEDTRRTGNLLRHYEIRTALISLHEHNERQRAPQLIRRLEAGESIALVTDAGTPGISDPGARVVAAVREHGFRIEPIPGPSAVVTALSIAGQPAERFAFLGFIPNRLNARKQLWERIAGLPDFLVVLFETPHRIAHTLPEIAHYLVNRPITLGRELTKTHEEVLVGTPSEILERLGTPKGEFTILIAPLNEPLNSGHLGEGAASDEELHIQFSHMTNIGGAGRREAIREVARRSGLSAKAVYEALERAKKLGHTTE